MMKARIPEFTGVACECLAVAALRPRLHLRLEPPRRLLGFRLDAPPQHERIEDREERVRRGIDELALEEDAIGSRAEGVGDRSAASAVRDGALDYPAIGRRAFGDDPDDAALAP